MTSKFIVMKFIKFINKLFSVLLTIDSYNNNNTIRINIILLNRLIYHAYCR